MNTLSTFYQYLKERKKLPLPSPPRKEKKREEKCTNTTSYHLSLHPPHFSWQGCKAKCLRSFESRISPSRFARFISFCKSDCECAHGSIEYWVSSRSTVHCKKEDCLQTITIHYSHLIFNSTSHFITSHLKSQPDQMRRFRIQTISLLHAIGCRNLPWSYLLS